MVSVGHKCWQLSPRQWKRGGEKISPPPLNYLIYQFLRIAQPIEHRRLRRIDGNHHVRDGTAAGHVEPSAGRSGEACIQAVRLGLENPAAMIFRLAERERASTDGEGDVRRIAGNSARDDTQQPARRIELVSQTGAGRTSNAGEVAGLCSSYTEQLEAVAGRQHIRIRRDVSNH